MLLESYLIGLWRTQWIFKQRCQTPLPSCELSHKVCRMVETIVASYPFTDSITKEDRNKCYRVFKCWIVFCRFYVCVYCVQTFVSLASRKIRDIKHTQDSQQNRRQVIWLLYECLVVWSNVWPRNINQRARHDTTEAVECWMHTLASSE